MISNRQIQHIKGLKILSHFTGVVCEVLNLIRDP